MKNIKLYIKGISIFTVLSCNAQTMSHIEIFETSARGNKLTKVEPQNPTKEAVKVKINPNKTFQKILGFGGSFTESTAHLLTKLSPENRTKIIEAYFGENGARYSLTRTTIASCDFSLKNYTYAPVSDDKELKHFSIQEDETALIPIIKEAQRISKDGFRIIASPWTAPPWMKDNNTWMDGRLLPQYYDTYALYFSKYLSEYKKRGIDIWGVTVVNEPHGNGGNWESMQMSPKEMTNFVEFNLAPKLNAEGFNEVKILGYDQNRAGLKEWVDEMYRSEKASDAFDGVAIHWYESTYDYFPKALDYAHHKNPNKYIIQTEACVDAEVPHWKDDDWYWSKEATDWGWDWAKEEEKYLHPKYVPVFRYARDIIGCLNHHVNAWVDWNMVLNRQGGPNWFKNWCIAPVIVDEEKDEVYFTPIYYTMAHFSRFIRPDAVRIEATHLDEELMLTAVENPDGSFVMAVFNPSEEKKNIEISVPKQNVYSQIDAKAIQTIIIHKN
ncbi:glycoside hydrolase family 30 protein [Riemerella anatipestifer]|uniref:Glycosyl hydrolase family 30 n=1 Tax=Riemerella anatipestifer TaxID=34085 RepID=A0A1S7DPQ1_RIEAN|nr:glycoside hydrolase family 30 protein [Riemerella anatipestifer]AQY21096.1 hypothetical protein AB406_0131 [Riemerella anatipestifer]MCO4304653.1 glycosyl hydrolase [Riemerella anatipestifer]MCO7353514.1 glycosyl hydrolase [Riemerella anatipestifer]MCQ4040001.1 glycosyl hydrolase [Riemerella anatipestifer]MCT6761630.1 glycosyl hydrolase [Riemerella anatipestifer]